MLHGSVIHSKRLGIIFLLCLVALLRDYHSKLATIKIPTAGNTPPFQFTKGCWQGGVRSPDEFNVIMRHALDDIVLFWQTAGEAFALTTQISPTETDKIHFDHVLWADNIVLITETPQQMQTELQGVTDKVYGSQLKWKPKSIKNSKKNWSGKGPWIPTGFWIPSGPTRDRPMCLKYNK